MATVTEKADSRRTVDERSHERVYHVTGAADEAAAIAAVEATAPATVDVMSRDDIEVESLDGNEAWTGVVRYRRREIKGLLKVALGLSGMVLSGSTTGGTERIRYSRETIDADFPAGKPALDFHGAIGVSDQGVEGVDVIVPTFRFSATKCHPSGSLPSLSTIYDLTGSVNNASVTLTDSITGLQLTFQAGELLFEGADWSNQRMDGGLEVTYHFAARPNRTNIEIQDTAGAAVITVAAKKGWEYLWVHFIETEDATGKRLVHRPRAAFVEQVYEEKDFSSLGL